MRSDLVEKFDSAKTRALEELEKRKGILHFFRPLPQSGDGLYL